jgi:hypothetical protein
MVTGYLPEVKWPGCGVEHPFPANAKVKERVELYLYPKFESSCRAIGRTLPLQILNMLIRVFKIVYYLGLGVIK